MRTSHFKRGGGTGKAWGGVKQCRGGLSEVGFWYFNACSLVAQLVKNAPAMQETLVQFLGREDPLEKG